MTRRGGSRNGTVAVVILLVAMAAVTTAFAWLRANRPSEPAAILTDTWDWSRDGVAVTPLGDGGPFQPGDRVVAIDGVTLETLAVEAVTPWGPGPDARADANRTFGVERGGGRIDLTVALTAQPIGGLLAGALPLLAYTVVQAAVALLAWLRRPAEGWRRGFLVGSVANVANAVTWELGLRATDLDHHEPMLLLFAIGVPLHVVFWSSIAHVMVSWPTRARSALGTRGFVVALYAVPLAAVAVALALAAAVTPSTLEWLGATERLLAAVVLVQAVVVLATLADAYRRIRGTADRSLRIIVVGCLVGVLAVGGLTVLPVLVAGQALAPRSGVAALGLPLAVLLLIGTLRSRLFEVDVLLASRRRLVMAREEERRRLRRDLHDSLGPMLAAMTLKADLARDLVRDDPAAADSALAALKADTQAAVAEVRRLTRELRPPALDELGLVEAIRQRSAELERDGGPDRERLDIVVTGPATPAPLGAAVEVAAYRIALEAMTNVLRHTRARRCEVRITLEGPLVLEIRDDGPGFEAGHRAGVGLTSMRERCAELGGRLAVERTADGWTVIRATLPV